MLCSFIFFQIFRADLFFGAHTVFHSAHTKQALRGNVGPRQKVLMLRRTKLWTNSEISLIIIGSILIAEAIVVSRRNIS